MHKTNGWKQGHNNAGWVTNFAHTRGFETAARKVMGMKYSSDKAWKEAWSSTYIVNRFHGITQATNINEAALYLIRKAIGMDNKESEKEWNELKLSELSDSMIIEIFDNVVIEADKRNISKEKRKVILMEILKSI